MLIVRHHEVAELLAGRERDVLDAVSAAYQLHDQGDSALPHSTFLRFPGERHARNRIIGLPAYLGGDGAAAGLKWIASFPGNVARGIDRASAVIVLNSVETGRPEALIEASLISAARTAASAALAADRLSLTGAGDRGVTLIGCGVINLAILQYLAVVRPELDGVVLYDQVTDRASAFAGRCKRVAPGVSVTVTDHRRRALATHRLISIATTATEPHMDLAEAPAGATVLHISLRDLVPAAILASHNVTDDPDHACRERTSLELAEQLAGDRGFIDATLGELLRTGRHLPRDPGKPVVFSPFGLGVLDLAVARLVLTEATRQGCGLRIDGFLPDESVLSGAR